TGEVVNGRTLIVATGARYRRLAVPRLEEYEGVGVYYAATQSEAQMCDGDPVLVVGGGNSAGQAAMFMSQHAASCLLMIRGGDLQDEQLSGFNGERPYFLETSQAGIFAVGDVHCGSVKRVASAVGEGSMAVRLVHQRLAAR